MTDATQSAPPPKTEPAASLAGRGLATGIAGAALLIMIGNLLSRVLGLVREQLASGLFGTGDRIAAFQIADNVHTLLYDLIVSGMLEAALIPVLIQWAAPDQVSRAELRRVSGALLTMVLMVVGGAVLAGVVFAPSLVRVMTSLGGDDTERSAETSQLTIELVRIILPAVFFLAIGTLLMSVLYSLKQVTAPALSLAARNAIVVFTMVVFSSAWGVKSMAVGVVAGAIAIAAMNAIPLWRLGALPKPNLDFRHSGVKEVLHLYFPIFLGLILSTLAVVVDRNLAWRAQEDALGAMRYATTLVQFLLGMVAAAISLASLPTLSGHHARGDEVAFRKTLERALTMVTILIVPAVFGLAALSRPVVDLLFRHGATDDAGAKRIALALVFYLPGTLFAAYDQILIYGFYARRNTWRPVLVGVISTGVYFAVAIPLGRSIGMVGLVAANSTQFIAHALIMIYLTQKVVGRHDWEPLLRVIARTVLAAVVTSSVAFSIWLGLDQVLPSGDSVAMRTITELLLAGIPAAVGAGTYVLLMHKLKVEEATELRRTVLGRIHPALAR
jgi:putative peptidoglycan lipid II flippase